MKALLVFCALLGLVLIDGCDNHRPSGVVGPTEIPFNLVIPDNVPKGDYYAISGITVQQQLSGGTDSLIEGTAKGFYAEFYTAPGITLPASVMINGNQLSRNLGGDTLRLESAVGLNPYSSFTWSLADTGGTPSLHPSAFVPAADSVRPFHLDQIVRADTSFTIQWKKGGTDVGMQLRWVAPSRTYIQTLNDFTGTFTVPAAIMATLRGKGTVTLTRFFYSTEPYNGKNLIVVRLAQNSYEVTVQS